MLSYILKELGMHGRTIGRDRKKQRADKNIGADSKQGVQNMGNGVIRWKLKDRIY